MKRIILVVLSSCAALTVMAERGLKVPTINKIDDIAEVLGVHPLTLLTLAYAGQGGAAAVDELIGQVKKELLGIAATA